MLTQKQLPPGFAPFYVGKQLRADQTPRRSDPARSGREGGWIARFHRGGSPKTKGPLVLASRVDLFKGASGAKDDLALYEADFSNGPGKPVDVNGLGEAAVGTTTVRAGALAVRSYAIAWRRWNATAEIEANGFGNRLTLADVLALARKQDALLRQGRS